ncbi:MAG: Xaa-Pro peptidase family protein [Thermodesulfobacteriota bacterium]|nr:Xaa-Pro peptidase family protein [Thermodesulfobacteriota bacterium]
MEKRLNKARFYLKGLDAVLFTDRLNIAYLCGFVGEDASLLITVRGAALFVDSRYTIQARDEAGGVEVYEVFTRWDTIFDYINEHGIKTLGIESNVMDVDTFIMLKNMFRGVEITPIGGQLKYLRIIKDSDEIAFLKNSAKVSEEAIQKVLEKGIIGRRERDVAFDIEWEMGRLGASSVAFEVIVASGPRSAMPHGVASDKVIAPNEAVVIDFGCIYKGYCSDQTITTLTGDAGDSFADVYNCVRDAQSRAVEGIKSGIAAGDVDAIARGFIKDHGFGEYFGHGLGHGVGMEVHEAPALHQRSVDILDEGMVFTIEPGIYIPGKFGVRIEDTFVITDNSCQRITNLDKSIIRKIN